MFCSPGKYLTLNLKGCSLRILSSCVQLWSALAYCLEWLVIFVQLEFNAVQVHMETFASPNNCQRFFRSLRIPLFYCTQTFLAPLVTLFLPCCSWISTAPRPTGLTSAIIRVRASLPKYPRDSALTNLLCSSMNALLCSSPNWNTPPFFVKLRTGSATLEKTGINCAL